MSTKYQRKSFCSIEDCNDKCVAKGLCQKHYNKQYKIDNKAQIVIKRRQYYLDNKEYIINHMKQYIEKNKEKWLDYGKQWREDHKQHTSEYRKQWYENNEKYIKQYCQDNKEHRSKYKKQWDKTSVGRASMKAHSHNRRALTKDLTKEMVQRVYEANIAKYGRLTCILCDKPIKFGDDSLEHLIPISRGGTNNFNNLEIAHFVCNCKKHTMTLDEWNAKNKEAII